MANCKISLHIFSYFLFPFLDESLCSFYLSTISGLTFYKYKFIQEFHDENLSLEGWQVWNRAANRLAKAGARIVSVSLPSSKFSLNTYHVICAADVASNMARFVYFFCIYYFPYLKLVGRDFVFDFCEFLKEKNFIL